MPGSLWDPVWLAAGVDAELLKNGEKLQQREPAEGAVKLGRRCLDSWMSCRKASFKRDYRCAGKFSGRNCLAVEQADVRATVVTVM